MDSSIHCFKFELGNLYGWNDEVINQEIQAISRNSSAHSNFQNSYFMKFLTFDLHTCEWNDLATHLDGNN